MNKKKHIPYIFIHQYTLFSTRKLATLVTPFHFAILLSTSTRSVKCSINAMFLNTCSVFSMVSRSLASVLSVWISLSKRRALPSLGFFSGNGTGPSVYAPTFTLLFWGWHLCFSHLLLSFFSSPLHPPLCFIPYHFYCLYWLACWYLLFQFEEAYI